MTYQSYMRTQIVLHWAVAGVLLVSFFSHDAMKDALRALERGHVYDGVGHQVHVIAGITILVLVAVRLSLRWLRGVPDAPSGTPLLMQRAATMTHWALYAVLVLMPISGMVAWFGGIEDAGEVHELLFGALFALVALHTVAALFHHYILKDGLIWRMVRAR